ncbi:MAG: hypothetical protein ACP5O7_09110 [Phycisphaerae bacterium]
MAYITPNKAANSRKHAHHQPIATALVVLLGLMAAPRLACAKPTETPALAPHLLDAITFGKPTSEAAHHFDASASQVINGGLGQPARVLLPLKPRQIYGDQMSFTLRCNPRRLNYITVKYWGNDRGEDLGRLILYCNGVQVGYRMMSDYGLISGAENAGSESYPGSRPFPGRFFYATEPLPRKTHPRQAPRAAYHSGYRARLDVRHQFQPVSTRLGTSLARRLQSLHRHQCLFHAPARRHSGPRRRRHPSGPLRGRTSCGSLSFM